MKKKLSREQVINEIESNRNHSWFEEIKKRASSHLSKVALRYRGLNITYGEYIENCEKIWAPALKAAGITKNTEFVVSINSTPEMCYLFGAASIVGARINLISEEFDADYIVDICKNASSEYIFVGEDKFNTLYPVLEKLTDKKIVPINLDSSLSNGNPFEKITSRFCGYNRDDYENNKNRLENVVSLDDFLHNGRSYKGNVNEHSTLDDIFTITYSSGTTDGNKPKGIVHANRHYIVMGRYHDPEVSGLPNLKDSITFSTIPTQSNSYIASILSDTLMEGASIALDPIIDIKYFIYGIKINRPYMAIATTSSWLYAAKYYYSLPREQRKHFIFSNTILPVAVGEPMSPGEEKFLNKFIADTKCGTGVIKLPHSISKMSICGGDCEHGSIFTRVLRKYFDLTKDRSVKEPIGLKTYDFVDVKVLRPDGTYCEAGEYGKLVANSECTMVGYKDSPERTKMFYVPDAYGNKWGDLACHGYVDRDGNVYMKGRMSEDKSKIPEFMINDELQKDTKNILSSSVVCSNNNGVEQYIAYIEPQIFAKKSINSICRSAVLRLRKKFGDVLIDNLYISVVDNAISFPLTGCIKRDNNKLRTIGVTPSMLKAADFVSDISKDQRLSLKKKKSY